MLQPTFLISFGVAVRAWPQYAVQITKDQVYAQGLIGCPRGYDDDPDQTCRRMDLKLDLYEPVGAPTGQVKPAIIFAHGGAFFFGKKDDQQLIGSSIYFARAGFVAASIDYRLALHNGTYPGAKDDPDEPKATPPQDAPVLREKPRLRLRAEQSRHLARDERKLKEEDSVDVWTPLYARVYPAVRDMKAAVRWLKYHAADYGVDRNKIAVAGHSAGGGMALAAGITFDGDFTDELTDEQDPTLASTHRTETSTVRAIYTAWSTGITVEMAKQHDPNQVSRYSSRNPPIIEFHGDEDHIVPLEDALAVQQEYDATGVKYELHVLEGCHHGGFAYGCETLSTETCKFRSDLPEYQQYCASFDYMALPFIMDVFGIHDSL
mmetsp:Transcript_56740/g.157974  ORF Transcript_56740/g.157974 Transcript_56740/m.157974 type:complete len:377 (+) Transcript_56740:81-1211(+)